MKQLTARFGALLLRCCIVLMLFAGWGVARLAAQSLCECPPDSLKTKNINICILGTVYNVNVTYCHIVYTPPSATAPCTSGGAAANAFTSIRKVCGTTVPLPGTDYQIMKAVSF